MIKAPFNFVPLSEKVYYPDWADSISQDVPFEDGMTGTIQLKITSNSPIFLRNGHTREDKEHETEAYLSSARMPNGQYYIPATSLKGAIRNVFEILTASKITFVQNRSFGIRELSGGDAKFYTAKITPQSIHCGWLRYVNDSYYLDDCGLPRRISAEEIDGKLGIGLEDFVKNGNFTGDAAKTAKAKYEMAKGCSLHGTFEVDEKLRKELKAGNRKFVKYAPHGEGGTIVFTGQPGKREQNGDPKPNGEKKWTGKYFDFVFMDETERKDIALSGSIMDDFCTIHQNSPDYKDFWKEKLDGGERIPVFFTVDGNSEPEALGLSYMFKYPAHNTIFNALREDDFNSDKMDMTECLFGKSYELESLKGRVVFPNAICASEIETQATKSFVLSTPHPSYYPLYLGKGQTWNSERIQIAGRKRYPVRNSVMESTEGTDDMKSRMQPLPKGIIFTGNVRFFNLKPVELGALLASLTFNGKEDCYHSIGAGKPYGLGKCKVEILDLELAYTENGDKKPLIPELIRVFNDVLSAYHDENALNELYAMARGIPSGKEDCFTYMQMSDRRKKNEFSDGKKDYAKGKQLGTFTEILTGDVPTIQFIGNVDAKKKRINIEEIKKREMQVRREKEARKIAQQEKEEAYATLLSEAMAAEEAGNYQTAVSKAEEAKRIFSTWPEPDDIIVRNKSLASQEERAREQAAKAAAMEAARSDKYNRPLSEVLAGTKYISQELAKWSKISGNEFGEEEYKVLVGALRVLDDKQMKTAIKSKKDISKAIGNDVYVLRLFSELGIK